jgi:hypothetical protein
VSLYSTTLVSYDIVIGMDWLEIHDVILHCKAKNVYFIDDEGNERNLVGMNKGVS